MPLTLHDHESLRLSPERKCFKNQQYEPQSYSSASTIQPRKTENILSNGPALPFALVTFSCQDFVFMANFSFFQLERKARNLRSKSLKSPLLSSAGLKKFFSRSANSSSTSSIQRSTNTSEFLRPEEFCFTDHRAAERPCSPMPLQVKILSSLDFQLQILFPCPCHCICTVHIHLCRKDCFA